MVDWRRIFLPRHAELMQSSVGEKYRPSNGTEGDLFHCAWCARCERDRAHRESKFEAPGCDIVARSFAFSVDDPEYPSEWIITTDGQPACTAFVPEGTAVQERCEHTHDMFGGSGS